MFDFSSGPQATRDSAFLSETPSTAQDLETTWGDARWDPRAEEKRDGKQDLEEARASVLTAKEEADAAASPSIDNDIRPSTFPEGSLKWIPRKRHNSRWPIEPKKEKDVGLPQASMEPVEVTSKMDEQQMMKRSTRRLSRRFSLFPGEESPRKLPMITLSPAQGTALVLSPVKRPPVSLSPTKVADSPLRSFRINATPTKVVLESPKTSPPAKSPAKHCSSPTTPTEDGATSPANKPAEPGTPAQPSSPAPLMFDQPSPGVQSEPQHEVRRRRSLQSARRSERGSSGVSRLLALKSGRNSPNRRHSFTSIEDLPAHASAGSKSRRNTMDNFSVGPDGIRGVDAKTEEVVEIDMKADLDIFGQPTRAAEPALQRTLVENGQSKGSKEVTRATFFAASPVSQEKISASSQPNGFDVSNGAEVGAGASPRQAATTPNAHQSDTEEEVSFIEPTPLLSDDPVNFPEGEQCDAVFAPHDPEGLSTIFEESVMETQSPHGLLGRQDALESIFGASPQSSAEKTPDGLNQKCFELQTEVATPRAQLGNASAAASASLSDAESLENNTNFFGTVVDATQMAVDEQLASESVPGTPLSVKVPTRHVANGTNAMSSPDSPFQHCKASSVQSSQEATFERQNADKSSLSNSEEGPPSDGQLENMAVKERSLKGDESSSLPSTAVQAASSPSRAATSTPALPGTPTTVPETALTTRVVTPEADVDASTAQQESSGFTPINGRQISPPNVPPSGLKDDDEAEAETESDELDADEVIDMDDFADEGCEPTVALDDETLTVHAPRPENDTLQLHARHDDSETEMLRKFVTRVTADKNAKAAAAAAALAKKTARRSSTTSSTGSPMAKPGSETPASRQPLGVKSPNSPSPAKKRKHGLVEDDDDLAKDTKPDAQDAADQPRLKRRRKRTDALLDTTTPPPQRPPPTRNHSDPSSGPRRSTRARSTRVALRPTAPSANTIAFSTMIPEKKGVRWDEELVRFQEAETSVFKGLARGLLADVVMGEVEDGDIGGVDEIAEAEPPAVEGPAPVKTARVAARKPVAASKAAPAPASGVNAAAAAPSTRRTRSSRLVQPTPVKKLGSGEKAGGEKAPAAAAAAAAAPAPAPSLRTRAKSLPKPAPAPAPAAASSATVEPTPAAAPTAPSTKMATRRTRIAKLGMSVNGTPAPKRRGRAVV
ncbi:hypothetical protein NEMBOFW57_009575 [Staphylotrichum longicolle]|uniref:Uncharacterized protein n=1 Tax=Staphylotrichum longicolle TaxID=669026 RepID=A0AAD4HTH4_9PEZI|nr:hypothetical protein NEMBOFW57_009575 [Staphylotrichum longicolle]